MLVLAFTLAIVAGITFLIMASVSEFNTKVVADPQKIRGFKHDKLLVSVTLLFKRSRWINVNLTSIKSQVGVDSEFEMKGRAVKVIISSKYAGRFTGLTSNLEIIDVLNLFSKEIQTVSADFVFESLPLSILTEIPHSKPMPLSLGEKSGGSPGSSLELYALDEYQPYTETRNIMWKRVARMPDESLTVRIRDSSIPKIITIGFVNNKPRRETATLNWMDLVCEAIGSMGNTLLASGCLVEIIYTTHEGLLDPISVHEVSSFDELSDSLVLLFGQPNPGEDMENLLQVIDRSDIVVCGMRELEDRKLAGPISRKVTLVVAEERSSPAIIGQRSMIYTGVEDVRKLIANVLEA
jgi:hypothetical protein